MSNVNIKSIMPKTSFRLLIFFLFQKKKQIFALLFFSFLTGLVPAFDSILSKKFIDMAVSLENANFEEIWGGLWPWAIIYTLWWEGINWVWRILDYVHLKTFPVIKASVIEKLYSYMQHHSVQFFQEKMVGYISNRVTEASRSTEMIFLLTAQKVLPKTTNVIASTITMYWVHPVFALILFTWVFVFVGIGFATAGRGIRYSTNYALEKATVAGKVVDIISNISAVRMFSTYKHEEKVLGKQLGVMVESEQRLEWFMCKLRYVQSLTCTIMIFIMVYYLASLRAAHQVTIGDFALILMLCVFVTNDIWEIVQEISELLAEYGVFSQSITLIEPYLVRDAKDATPLQITDAVIEFCDVNFKYKKDTYLFNDKNLIIKGGQKVGLVGYSGSGKTTFVNLISRLYDINSGKILIDSQDISKVTQVSLRDAISLIPQEPILFHRTVFENIAYGTEATEQEVIEAAKKARIHDVIMNLPEGYNTLCGERGNNLSGGQRQRIVIARAILRNSPILILDEATSALDTITEKYIQESMQYLMKDKTVIVIAHRLSTLLDMDRILVFDSGKIVEDGSHKNLLKKKGLYYKLWNSQIEGFLNDH